MSNKELVEKCLQGDQKSQRRLYELYSSEMYAISMRYARHELEAQDIMHDAFIIIFDKLHTLKNYEALKSWMIRILINVAIRNYNKSAYQKERLGLEDYDEKSIDASAVQKMTEKEILDIIDELPDGYKAVFNLYAIDGYKHKEIADMLDIAVSTSRSQLVKARRMLMNLMKNLHSLVI